MIATALLLAAEDIYGVNPWALGIGGVLALCTWRKWLIEPTYVSQNERDLRQQEKERADRLEEEVRRLNADMQKALVPALVSGTDAVTQAMSFMADYAKEQELERRIREREER